VKAIANVRRVRVCQRAHYCEYKDGWPARDEKGEEVGGSVPPHPTDKVCAAPLTVVMAWQAGV
jgi:hypothetical protein